MSLAGLWTFIITCVGLAIIVALIFLLIEMLEAPDPRFKKIARFVVGAAGLLMFLYAVGGVLGMGGGINIQISPSSIIEFGIGALILLLVLWLVYRMIDYFAFWVNEIKFIVSAIALIIILVLAEKAMTGGLGLVPNFGAKRAESQVPAINAVISPPQTQIIR